MEQQKKTVLLQLSDYPYNMQPKDIASFLNVSLSTAYSIIKNHGFPMLKMPGSRLILIPKDNFADWYIKHMKINSQKE